MVLFIYLTVTIMWVTFGINVDKGIMSMALLLLRNDIGEYISHI